MRLPWQAKSNALTWWWGMLTLVSGVNIALWFLACVCTFRLSDKLWNRQVAAYATFMVATGKGQKMTHANVNLRCRPPKSAPTTGPDGFSR